MHFYRLTNIVLRGKGGVVALSTTMQDNSSSDAYAVEVAGYSTCGMYFIGASSTFTPGWVSNFSFFGAGPH